MDPARADGAALLDIEQLAAALNITTRHVRRLVAERRVPYLKVGAFIRFDPDQIEEWAEGLAVPTRDRVRGERALSRSTSAVSSLASGRGPAPDDRRLIASRIDGTNAGRRRRQ